MTERPIAFSPAMVSAILDRRKVTTRRIMPVDPETGEIRPPRIGAGDLLWVRETHYRVGWWEPLEAGGWCFVGPDECSFDPPTADFRRGPPSALEDKTRPGWYARPAMFMPRRFARLTLRVTRVHSEPLHSLSAMDAQEEGIVAISKDGRKNKFGIPDRDGLPGRDNEGWPWDQWKASPEEAFRALWESLHGAGSWALNPYVAVIAFEPETRP